MDRREAAKIMAEAVADSKHGDTFGVAIDALCDAIPALADYLDGKPSSIHSHSWFHSKETTT